MSAVLPYRADDGQPARRRGTPSLRPLPTVPSVDDAPSPTLLQRLRRIGPLGPIVLAHIGLFYAIESGMVHHVVKAPQVMFASLIDAPPARPQPQPELKPVQPSKLNAPALVPLPLPEIVTAGITPPPAASAAREPDPSPARPSAAQSVPVAPVVSGPRTVSGVEYLQPPQPSYPPLSRRTGEQGKVMLRVLVSEKGRADRIEIERSSGYPRLDEAAKNAVARAVFKPHVEDGKPIPVFVVVPINFSLD